MFFTLLKVLVVRNKYVDVIFVGVIIIYIYMLDISEKYSNVAFLF